MQQRDVLFEDEVAEKIGLSRRRLAMFRKDGGGPPFVMLSPRRLGYRPADLDKWLADRTVERSHQVAA